MALGKTLTRAAAAGLALTLGSASIAGAQTETTVVTNGSGDAEVVPLSPKIASVDPGDSQWIAINWTSLHADAREFKVTAIGSEGVIVGYPAFPVDGYSSGYWDDTLTQSETDYTALKITVREDAPAPHFLRVTASWVSDTGEHTETIDMPFDNVPDENGGDNSNGGSTTTVPPTTTPPTTAAPTTAVPTTAPPTTAAPTTAPPTTAAPAPIPEVFTFYLVDAKSDERIMELTGGEVISLREYGNHLTIEATANDVTESVAYVVNDQLFKIEEWFPYTIVGDYGVDGNGNIDYAAWSPKTGSYDITAIPYAGDTATGQSGISQSISIEVVRR